MEDSSADLKDKQNQKENNEHDDNNNFQNEENKEKYHTSSILESTLDYKDIDILQFDNNEYNKIDLSFKVIVIGNSGVGKSSLVERATKNKFLEDYSATIGFDYCSFFIKYNNKTIKLQIWDTCGQEIYQSLITNFYKNSSLAILVYAIDDRKSFDDLDSWLKDLKKESNPDTKSILIGNKADLVNEREVPYEEAEKYSKDYDFFEFYETSARTGLNAQKVFVKAAITLYEDYLKYKDKDSIIESEKNSIENSKKLTKRSSSKKKHNNSGCCQIF